MTWWGNTYPVYFVQNKAQSIIDNTVVVTIDMNQRTHRPAGFQGYTQQSQDREDEELTHVTHGTPCGEYLRRYWQPIGMSSELGKLPLLVKILGEELVLFRDKSNNVGLLHKHCAHRGASLEYGIVAERGIICCYHGWHYDVDGTLIRAGSERADSPICRKVVQGAYPVREKDGILFTYMGPPDKCPDFPEYDTQHLDGVEAVPFSLTTPCNWLQIYENTQDPIHVLHLHSRSSGIQFGVASGVDQIVEYETSPTGMVNIQTRQVGEFMWARTVETILPNANQTGAIWEEAEAEKYFQRVAILRWMVPIDNFVTRTIGWRYFSEEIDPRDQGDRSQVGKERIDFIGQTQDERPYSERQLQPGDFEAQVSQRPIAIHSQENLASSDGGVARLRQLLREHVRGIAKGVDPPQPTKGYLGRVSTYTQDTVHPIKLDPSQRREFGREVAAAVLNSGHLSYEERIQAVRRSCHQFLSS